jgi:hypothetical protein
MIAQNFPVAMVGQADSHFHLGAAAQPACANVSGCAVLPIGLRQRGPLNRALEAIACALLSLLSAFCRDFSRGRGYGPLSSVGYFFMSQGRGSTILGRFYYSPPVDYGLPAPNSLLPIAVNQGLRPQNGHHCLVEPGFYSFVASSNAGTTECANQVFAPRSEFTNAHMDASIGRPPPLTIVCWDHNGHTARSHQIASVLPNNHSVGGRTISIGAAFPRVPIVSINAGG